MTEDTPTPPPADRNSEYYYALWMNARAENEGLRGLVDRLTDKLDDFVREHPDPGSDALAAVYCFYG